MTTATTNDTATNVGAASTYDANAANGNGHHSSFENEKPYQAPMYNGGSGANGNHTSRTLTPGGHFAHDDLIAIANTHRRIANPLPLGGKSRTHFFSLTTQYDVQVVY